MSPFVLLSLGVGILLLWYAFKGGSPIDTIKAVVAPGTAKAKSTTTGTGNKQNGG